MRNDRSGTMRQPGLFVLAQALTANCTAVASDTGRTLEVKLGVTRAFKWAGPSWPNILAGKSYGGSAGTGPILPETFHGDNSTFRMKWIRIFKPSGNRMESEQL